MAGNNNPNDGNMVSVPFASNTPELGFAAELIKHIDWHARSLAVGAGRLTARIGADGRLHYTFSFRQDRPGREGASIVIEPDKLRVTITGPIQYNAEGEVVDDPSSPLILDYRDSEAAFAGLDNIIREWRDRCFHALIPEMPRRENGRGVPVSLEVHQEFITKARDEFIEATYGQEGPARTWWTVEWEKGVPHLAIYHGRPTGEPPYVKLVFDGDRTIITKYYTDVSPETFFVYSETPGQWKLCCVNVNNEIGNSSINDSKYGATEVEYDSVSFIDVHLNPEIRASTVNVVAVELSKYQKIAPAFLTFEMSWDSDRVVCSISGECGSRVLTVRGTVVEIGCRLYDQNAAPQFDLRTMIAGASVKSYLFSKEYIPNIRREVGEAIFNLFAPDLPGKPDIACLDSLLLAATSDWQTDGSREHATWAIVPGGEGGAPRLRISHHLRAPDGEKAPIIEATLTDVGQLEITRPGQGTQFLNCTTNEEAAQQFAVQCEVAENDRVQAGPGAVPPPDGSPPEIED